MSRSQKDGRTGGGHHETRNTGKEYWSRRPPTSMATPGRISKTATHRAERRQNKVAAIGAEAMSEKPVPLEELLQKVVGRTVSGLTSNAGIFEIARRLRAVAALHQPAPILYSKLRRCFYCSSLMPGHLQEMWPCPTARALAGEREE